MIRIIDYNFIGNKIRIRFESDFYSRCPIDKKLDRTILQIYYIPNEKLIEANSFREFIIGFVDQQIYYEDIVNVVFNLLVKIKPKYLLVKIIDPFGLKMTLTRSEKFLECET